MDEVTAVGASTTTSTTANRFSELGSDEFVKIILTELSSQDPLEPNDTAALLDQLSTLRSIQSDTDMMDRLGSLVGQGEMTSAAGLLGTDVRAFHEDLGVVTGRVDSIVRGSEGVLLGLEDGTSVRFDNVLEFHAPTPATP